MSDEAPKTEVKWWDKKVLLRSVLVGLAFFGLFWMLAERVKPPEGYAFEKLPTTATVCVVKATSSSKAAPTQPATA